MRRLARISGLVAGALVALPLAAGCSLPPSAGNEEPAAPENEGQETAEGAGEAGVEEILAGMTLEEKVGQLFVTYAYGADADTSDPADVAANQEAYGVDNAAELVEKYQLGGVIYFDWAGNTGEPHRMAELSNGLQRAALERGPEIPLLISIDQEGGPVTRIGEPATRFPDAATIGAAGDSSYAYEAARFGGRELRAMGINHNYAPVADVNVNPANPVIGERSFGADPELAAEMTAAQVRGYQSEDVAATAKHFPGHGDTDVDSHIGVPVITHTFEEWEELDEPPFAAAVEAGVDSVLTGHLVFPELDESRTPATLSEPIITGLLRDRLGYDGVVVTDALDMEGVRESYGDERVPVLALQAGVDLLLQSPQGHFDLQYNAVLEAVAEGELTEERLDESVRRVLALKQERGLFDDPFADPDRATEVVGDEEHAEWARRIAEAGAG